MIGGVASGVAGRLGLETSVVRVLLVLTVLLGGAGIAGYVLAWLLIPAEGQSAAIAAKAASDRRGIALALALVPALTVLLVVASLLGAGWLSSLAWPLFIAAGGMVLVWRNAGEEERPGMEQALGSLSVLGITGRHRRRAIVLRAIAALALVGVGLGLLTDGRTADELARPLGGVIALFAGALVVFGPWWLKVARALVDERQARALAEERADIAARIHDSVLQTLALIQRRADDPQQVVQLARAQERELRGWLLEGRVPGAIGDDGTVASAIARIQRDVEAQHGVRVESVVVGDCELDERLRNLLEAGREATVNAAKWSGTGEVSLFVEVQAGSVAMYVRDRGKGFDEKDVPADRKGVTESIRGRMARHGGTAEIRSSPGEGTEVTLVMARRPDPASAATGREATR